MADAATTFEDQAAAEAAIRGLAPEAVELTAIEAALDATLHSVFLDAAGGRVLWAYQEPGDDTWTLDIQPAAEAAEAADQLDGALVAVRDRLDDPASYADYSALIDVDGDQAAIDELHDVQLVAVTADDTHHRATAAGVDPVVRIDGLLKRRVEAARQQVSRAAALRAYYLRSQVGGERGDQAALARRLGTTRAALGEVLERDVKRRDRIRGEAAKARIEA